MRLVPASVDSVAGEVADPLSCRIITANTHPVNSAYVRTAVNAPFPGVNDRNNGWGLLLSGPDWISCQPSPHTIVGILG